MAKETNSNSNPHIVLFPFLAQGHINPFISFASLLHHHHPSLTITLVSTPRNVASIAASLPSNSSLKLHALPFSPESFSLPPNTESLISLRFDQFISFYNASLSLRPAFESFISSVSSNSKRVCVIADFFFAWSVDVTRKFNAYHSIFVTSGVFGTAVFFSLCTHLPKNLKTGDEYLLPEYPEVKVHKTQVPKYFLNDEIAEPWNNFLQGQILQCYKTDSMLANTVEEVESTGLNMLRKTFNMPVWPVGPLLHISNSSSSVPSETENKIITWLDSQTPSSVLFISFGSQNTIQASQMMELAIGLEASGKPFIWVIRPPVGFDVKGEFKPEWLPEGFDQRMKENNKGIFVHEWAPQIKILSHKSTGAFLSHCGWNSSLESLVNGKPIIGWPLSAEQFQNSTMLVKDCGVSVELARGNMENSHVEREKAKEAIEMVMGENEKGREIREKAREIKELMERAWNEDEGSSFRALNEFLKSAGLLD
ncbi:hypothetical protein LUZ60_016257 [Juncus effusus]|nr:hypothetical protein LUZ60_016257 [Juncus effusus]